MFFSKNAELVNQMHEQREFMDNQQKKFMKELKVRDRIKSNLDAKIKDMKQEILLGKRILKDPNLSHMATRKFNTNIEKFQAAKFLVEGCQITDLIEEQKIAQENYEVELFKNKQENKILPGMEILMNNQIPAGKLSQQIQFKKLNFS